MSYKRVIVYDFETNGFFCDKTQPIEVCVKIIEDGKIDYYHSYINIRDGFNYVPYNIVDLTGITKQILDEKGRNIRDVFSDLYEIFNQEGNFVVGYNIMTFDNKFLEREFKAIGKDMPSLTFFDCQMQFKSKLCNIRRNNGEDRNAFYKRVNVYRAKGAKYKLIDAVNHYGIPKVDAFHGAKADVDYTHEVYLRQREEIMNARNK